MKRILSLILALTLVFALVACSNEKNTSSDIDTSTHNTTQSDTESTDDTSTESNESNTTDENSSITETPSNSKPTNTETSKPTTNSNNNTQTSKPTESSKPTQSTTGNNSSNNNTNNNNNSNNNNSSNNSTTTPPESKPEEIEYCNESLIIERNFTPETFLASVMDFYNNNTFETGGDVAAFSESDLANGFAKFDILGYALASTQYPLCDFWVLRDGNENFIKIHTFSVNKSCIFKTEADVVRALKRDIDKFTRFLGDLGCSYYYRDKTTMKSVSSFTDDMILSIAKGDNSDLKIEITAKNTFDFGNNEKRFSLTLKCTKTDYGYSYSIRY